MLCCKSHASLRALPYNFKVKDKLNLAIGGLQDQSNFTGSLMCTISSVIQKQRITENAVDKGKMA